MSRLNHSVGKKAIINLIEISSFWRSCKAKNMLRPLFCDIKRITSCNCNKTNSRLLLHNTWKMCCHFKFCVHFYHHTGQFGMSHLFAVIYSMHCDLILCMPAYYSSSWMESLCNGWHITLSKTLKITSVAKIAMRKICFHHCRYFQHNTTSQSAWFSHRIKFYSRLLWNTETIMRRWVASFVNLKKSNNQAAYRTSRKGYVFAEVLTKTDRCTVGALIQQVCVLWLAGSQLEILMLGILIHYPQLRKQMKFHMGAIMTKPFLQLSKIF